MAGLRLSSGISSLVPVGMSVQARRQAQMGRYSRARSGESGAGLQAAG